MVKKMAILNSDALKAIETKLTNYKLNVSKTPHGYPISEVTDMLDTIRALKTAKKRFQHLADRRARALAEIFSTASRVISEVDDTI